MARHGLQFWLLFIPSFSFLKKYERCRVGILCLEVLQHLCVAMIHWIVQTVALWYFLVWLLSLAVIKYQLYVFYKSYLIHDTKFL